MANLKVPLLVQKSVGGISGPACVKVICNDFSKSRPSCCACFSQLFVSKPEADSGNKKTRPTINLKNDFDRANLSVVLCIGDSVATNVPRLKLKIGDF